MRQLILVRHGYPDHMDRGLTGGWTDSHLTARGRHQARRTGRRLATLLAGKPFQFFSSDLARAAETADTIGRAIGAAPTLTPDLREQSLGLANNMTDHEAGRIALNPTAGPPVDRLFFPAAETWRQMMARVFAFMDRIDRTGEDTSLVVGHAGAGAAVIFWWLGLAPDLWPGIQFELDLCSITLMTTGEFDGRRIVRLNDVSHLGKLA